MMLDDHYSRCPRRTPTMPAAEQQALAERYAGTHDRPMRSGSCSAICAWW